MEIRGRAIPPRSVQSPYDDLTVLESRSVYRRRTRSELYPKDDGIEYSQSRDSPENSDKFACIVNYCRYSSPITAIESFVIALHSATKQSSRSIEKVRVFQGDYSSALFLYIYFAENIYSIR